MSETFINHAIKMYEALFASATDKPLTSDSETTVRVFAGNYTDVWKSTKIAQTYYSPIKKSLEKHNAIEFLQRGGRSVDTVLVLHGLPDVWEVDGWKDGTGLTKTVASARLASDVAELKKSTGGINVLMALQEYEARLIKLEKQVSKLTNTNT